ncbi:MAG: serine O-acetyltransferase [Alphaproteobacteria bacterium]|nr:serine O-acetyltransferase [Alphaproteobacteria bacterium]
MTGKPRQHSTITSVDPLWQAVRRDAETLSSAEPVMAALALVTVLNHDSFESALAFRLAARLDHGDLPGDLIRQTFENVLATNPEIGAAARTDLSATLERDPACHRAIEPLLYFKGYHAIQTHRFAHALWNKGRKDLALYLQSRSSLVFQADINPNVPIGKGIMLDHGTGLVVGETAVIGDDVSILQGVTLGGTGKEDGDRHPKVESGVLIGAGAKILGNITIGCCARIAAGSVVLKAVPPHTTVAGVPAKVIGEAGCAQPALSMDQMLEALDGKA